MCLQTNVSVRRGVQQNSVSFWHRLMGAEGGLDPSIKSPYTSRILKAFIRSVLLENLNLGQNTGTVLSGPRCEDHGSVRPRFIKSQQVLNRSFRPAESLKTSRTKAEVEQ